MKLISDIINELVDSEKSISAPLLKTKVLASRIKNNTLLDWVNDELNGYNNSESIPDYRKFSCNLSGTYMNGYYRFTNQPFPTSGLPEPYGNFLRTMDFAQSVGALEGLKSKGGAALRVDLSAEMISILEQYIKSMGNPFLQILEAHKSIPPTALNQILSVIRSKLLDFMLKLEEEFGTISDIQELQKSNKKITSIMHQTIITNGSGNVLNTGDSAQIRANISITTGDKTALKNALHENGVSENDVNDLLTIIDTESPEKGNFGKQVNEWIGKMLSKALDGSWQIGVGAAGGMLAEAIQHYYGLK